MMSGRLAQDKVYTVSTVPPLLSTYALGLALFQQHAVEPIMTALLKTLLAQIRLDRRGEAVNKSAIRSCIEMLVGLGAEVSVYKSKFEPVFLDETRDFYAEEARTLLEVDNVGAPQYLSKVRARELQALSLVEHAPRSSDGWTRRTLGRITTSTARPTCTS
jgi:cullin 3